MERRSEDLPDELAPDDRVVRRWLRRADELLRARKGGDGAKKGGEKTDKERERPEPR